MRHEGLTLAERIASAYIGMRYGKLVVRGVSGLGRQGRAKILVRCDCGIEKQADFNDVRSSNTQSCGCLHSELSREKIRKVQARCPAPGLRHGHTLRRKASPEYNSWAAMWHRCSNPKARGWKYWGGAGVTVCDRWKDFVAFLEDMGPRPKGTSIHRVNPFGNYEPGNCIWATAKEQRANQRNSRAHA